MFTLQIILIISPEWNCWGAGEMRQSFPDNLCCRCCFSFDSLQLWHHHSYESEHRNVRSQAETCVSTRDFTESGTCGTYALRPFCKGLMFSSTFGLSWDVNFCPTPHGEHIIKHKQVGYKLNMWPNFSWKKKAEINRVIIFRDDKAKYRHLIYNKFARTLSLIKNVIQYLNNSNH